MTSIRGRPSSASGMTSIPVDPRGLRVPRRPDAEQRQDLGDVVALRAHRRRAPRHEPDHLRQLAGLGAMAVEERVGEPAADLPGQLGGQRPRVDASRSCARSAARRCRPRVGAPDGPAGMWRPCSARTTAVELVGRAQDPRDDLVAREAQRAPHAVVVDAEHVAGRRRPRLGVPVARGQPVEQRHVRRLEPVDDVAGARDRAAEALAQAVRDGRRRRARRGHEGGLVEPVRGAHRAPQAGDVARPEPHHRRHQAAQLLAARRAARARAARP